MDKQTRTQQASTFLSALYGGLPLSTQGVGVYTWEKSGTNSKRTMYHVDTASCADYAVTYSLSGKDVYIGMALVPYGVTPPTGRPTKAQARGIVGLWLDVDVKDTGMASVEAAISLVRSAFCPPSVIVNSGGGIHAHWLFKEPLNVTSSDAKMLAEDCNKRLAEIHRQLAGIQKLDSVFDMGRIMRIPGTVNQKYPADCTLIECNDDRYEFDTLRRDLGGVEVKRSKDAQSNDLAIALPDEGIRIPFSELEAAFENLDAKFRQTWEHKRSDLPSQSEHDFSLANFLAHAGFEPQRIADWLVANRFSEYGPGDWGTHGNPQDYLVRTISTAVNEAGVDRRERERDARTKQAVTEVKSLQADPIADNDKILGAFTRMIDSPAPIKEFLQSNDDPDEAYFTLVFGGGEKVPMKKIVNITTQERFRDRFAVVTGRVIPQFTKKDWIAAINTLMRAREIQGIESTKTLTQASDDVRFYWLETGNDSGQWQASAEQYEPFVRMDDDGAHVYLHIKTYHGFLERYRKSRKPLAEVESELRELGFAPVEGVQYRLDKRKRQRRGYYRIPVSVLVDPSETGSDDGGGST